MKLGQLSRCLVVGVLLTALFITLAPRAKAASPVHKIGRGLGNIIIAPLEIPVFMVSEAKKNPFLGLITGPLTGAINCVTRVIAGTVELITFPIPPYDRPLYGLPLGKTVWE